MISKRDKSAFLRSALKRRSDDILAGVNLRLYSMDEKHVGQKNVCSSYAQPTAPEDSDANEMAGALWERFQNLADNSGPVQSL